MIKSFFEYLGLADVERVHSQFLAWVLSEDCNAIEATEKQSLFKNLFRIEGQIIQIHTERNNIDIFIQTATDIVVIENKIKSSQHSNQLHNYKQYCDKEFPIYNKHFFFLTLIGEKTSDEDWKRLSYSNIYEQLNSLNLKQNNTHSSIIKEYLIFLERLMSVLSDFNANVKKYDIVFFDGHKKKQDKKRSDYKNENEWFIASNQLETILQKSFLSLLIEEIKPQIGTINETRGTALLDFIIKNDIEFNGKKYSTGIQLQGNTVKLFFVISDKYNESQKEWVNKVVSIMENISKDGTNNFGYKKLNKPKKLTFISISKKLEINYWHMSNLKEFILREIENGKKITGLLTEHLKD
jgi:hypothetical protein